MAKTNKQVHDEKVEAINTLLQTIKIIAAQFEIQNEGRLVALTTGLKFEIKTTYATNVREARITLPDDSRYWSIKFHPDTYTVLDDVCFDEKGTLTGEGMLYFITNTHFLTSVPDVTNHLNQVKNWKHI